MSFNGLFRIVIRLFMILFFLTMSLVGWALLGEGIFINYILRNGNSDLVETQGIVVGKEDVGIIHIVDVEYYANGQKYIVNSNFLLGKKEVNNNQTVLYDSQDVSKAIIKSTPLGHVFIVVGLLIILISYVITVYIPKKLLKHFLPKKAKESSIRINLASTSQNVSKTFNNVGIDVDNYKETDKSYYNTYENDDTENPIK